jgi:hypothetical protein
MYERRRSAVSKPIGRRWAAAALVIVTVATGAVLADQRFLVPQEDPGGPFYARIEWGLIHHTDEWAAIPFYRELACVPPDFNLLRFFDPMPPRAFSCPLTAHGFVIYKTPGPGMAPHQAKLEGNGAVPILFVRWEELEAAVADNRVTLTELQRMSSVMQGSATFFQETLHPTGGAQQTMLEINAYGALEDGRPFEYHVTEVKGDLVRVAIAFD